MILPSSLCFDEDALTRPEIRLTRGKKERKKNKKQKKIRAVKIIKSVNPTGMYRRAPFLTSISHHVCSFRAYRNRTGETSELVLFFSLTVQSVCVCLITTARFRPRVFELCPYLWNLGCKALPKDVLPSPAQIQRLEICLSLAKYDYIFTKPSY